MFGTLNHHATLFVLTAAMSLTVAGPCFAQPNEAQKEAVRAACRSDFMAHCSGVTPGGEAALQCLARNMSSLSSGCQGTVKSIEASVEPKSEPAKSEATKSEPAKAETAPAAAPKSGSAKPAAAPKSAGKAAAPVSGGSAPAAAGAAPAAAPAIIVLRPMRPREELFVLRSACAADIRTLCAGVAPGGGRIMQCIANRGPQLSPACRDVLVPFMAR
ncbi:cysteine rich repeat-containing protein [Bradyrhizobium sp.]|uniref:cysteine rich repeat-containing protein n=1 Tax=Bradyrhizobium sp. TaxID=376 RepID=UPI003D0CE280